jgi:uncharacterized protein YceH (UPF0502 family)
VDYDDEIVSAAIESLRHKRYAAVITGSGRVSKYAQRISETLNLGRRELAVLCTLMLRGPQTLGEIKDRSERIFAFADLEETERVLEKMAEFPAGALARKLPRMAGHKEARFTQLLTGEPETEAEPESTASLAPGRVTQLDGELAALRSEVAELRKRLEVIEDLMR